MTVRPNETGAGAPAWFIGGSSLVSTFPRMHAHAGFISNMSSR